MSDRALLIVCLGLAVSATSEAQPVRHGPVPDDAVSAGVAFVRFGPDEPDTPAWFEVKGVAPVMAYTRPGMSLSVGRLADRAVVEGEPSDLVMVDATLLVHNDLRLFGPPKRNGIDPLVPIAITTSWRRVEQTRAATTTSLFEYQTLGLGTGIGARAVRSRWMAEVRATPSVALATRSFGGTVGFTWGLDTGAWLNVGPVAGHVGLSVGYGFSWKRWRVGGPEAVAVAGRGRFNYTGSEHALRLGLSW